jgi:hypothetical protein
MKMNQFWKLYSALIVVDVVTTLLLPFAWHMSPQLVGRYYSELLAGIIPMLMADAIQVPVFWFLLVPFTTDREGRFANACKVAITLRVTGCLSVLLGGPEIVPFTQVVGLIAFVIAVFGFIVWFFSERKMPKEEQSTAQLSD